MAWPRAVGQEEYARPPSEASSWALCRVIGFVGNQRGEHRHGWEQRGKGYEGGQKRQKIDIKRVEVVQASLDETQRQRSNSGIIH